MALEKEDNEYVGQSIEEWTKFCGRQPLYFILLA